MASITKIGRVTLSETMNLWLSVCHAMFKPSLIDPTIQNLVPFIAVSFLANLHIFLIDIPILTMSPGIMIEHTAPLSIRNANSFSASPRVQFPGRISNVIWGLVSRYSSSIPSMIGIFKQY